MKLPAFQFYPADWKKDIKVQTLSFEERGIWFEILCLMHESEDRGKLVINKKPMDEEIIARLIGCDLTLFKKILQRFLDLGVAYKAKNGIIYNKRMVNDEAKRKSHKDAGFLGGNPKLSRNYNVPGFVYAVRRESDGAVKIGIAKNVKNRFLKLKYSNKKDELELLREWSVNDMGKEEEKLHKFFENKKIIGEWFRINELDLENIDFTLKGTSKGEARASSSSSSSTSFSTSDNISSAQVFEFLRMATFKTISDRQLYDEAQKFIDHYAGTKILNLRALCNTWASNLKPEKKKLVI